MSATTTAAAIEPAVRKTAIFLLTLGEQSSAEIIKRLTEEELQKVTEAMASTGLITRSETEEVLIEFYRDAMARNRVLKGGVTATRRMLETALGPETARRHVGHFDPDEHQELGPLRILENADPLQLASLLKAEHPQTVALLLSQLATPAASGVLKAMAPEMQAEVFRRMARLDRTAPEVVHQIAAALDEKLRTFTSQRRENFSGLQIAVDLCKSLDPALGDEILNQVAEKEQELAEEVRRRLFLFEDFIGVEVSALKEVMARVDRKLMLMALKGSSESVRTRFMQCMSQSGAEMFLEDIDALGPVKIKEVDAAQQQVITVARQLEKTGAISLSGSQTDAYVV